MALREEVILDIRAALRQLDELQSQLSGFSTPISIPVEVRGEEALADLRRQADAADTTVDIDVDTFGLEQADQVFEDITGEAEELRGEISRVEGRANALGQELRETGRLGTGAFSSLRQSIGPLVATLAAGFGIRELTGFFRDAITAATDLAESANAVNVVFQEGAADLLAFGETASQSVGLAAAEFNQLVVPIGALLQNFNLDGREAAQAAQELTTRAADLASVFNTDVNDALQAVGAALRGEQEPIRRYGVNLNQAAIDAEALRLGLVGVGEEVSQAARGQAAYSLLLEQTAFAAGDFANTADSAANRQRILTAEWRDAQAELGEALLPAFENLLDAMPGIINAFENAAPALAAFGSEVIELAADAAGLLGPLGELFNLINRETGGSVEGVFDSFVDSVQGTEDTVGRAGERVAEFLGLFDLLPNVGSAAAQFDVFEGAIRGIDRDLADGASAVEALNAAFSTLTSEGVVLTNEALDALQATAGATDEEFSAFLQRLLAQRQGLNLTEDTVRALVDALTELEVIGQRGEGLNFARGARSVAADLDVARVSLDDFRGSLDNAFSQTEADRVLRETFGDLPVIISDLDGLQQAADEAGVSLSEFVTDVPEDITINVDPALVSIGILVERLEEVQALLADPTPGPEAEIEVPVNAEGEIDVDAFLENVVAAIEAEADVEADLGQVVLTGGVDAAAFLQGFEPDVAAALAEAFALDEGASADLQAALDGSLEGLAQPAADALAAAMETATPAAIADLGVFAAENFVSDVIRGQIAESAAAIATALDEALSVTTISPSIIIDLSNAQVQGVINTGQVPVNTGDFGDTPGTGSAPPPPRTGPGGIEQDRVVVNINNATTQNVETSATQAAQTIQAVASSLVKVD